MRAPEGMVSIMNTKRKRKLIITCGLLGLMMVGGLKAPSTDNMISNPFVITAQAAEATPTFSSYWYQDVDGTWKVKDNNGNIIKNAWLCDDAVTSNGKEVWYLLDSNGNMVTSGLVQDNTGNFYSLETNHNGYYGMLRYKSGNYDGIYLDLEASHNGSFAKIKNADGIEALKAKYGVTTFTVGNESCVYTSEFNSTGGGSYTPNTSTSNTNDSSQASDTAGNTASGTGSLDIVDQWDRNTNWSTEDDGMFGESDYGRWH